jgi:hypothetical protein
MKARARLTAVRDDELRKNTHALSTSTEQIHADRSCTFEYNNHVVRRSLVVILSLSAILLPIALLRAHTFYTTKITWSRDVSRIVYRNCVSCHRAGGSSFSLMTYKEARPWAEAIKEQVLNRRMPPWNAVKGFGEFRDDHGLTQEDLEIVGEWAEGGAPEGNPIYMPPVPVFNSAGGDPMPSHTDRLRVLGMRKLTRKIEAAGIELADIPSSGAIQVIATRPSGAIEPLIWIEKFNPNYGNIYYFRETLRLPAGTTIEITPPQGAAALVLLPRNATSAR